MERQWGAGVQGSYRGVGGNRCGDTSLRSLPKRTCHQAAAESFLVLPSAGAEPEGHPAGIFLGNQPAVGKAGMTNKCAKGLGRLCKGAWWGPWLNGDTQPIFRGGSCSGPAGCGHVGKEVRL